jgi:hypothetical protein
VCSTSERSWLRLWGPRLGAARRPAHYLAIPPVMFETVITSAASQANPSDAKLAGQVLTLFKGETLRGLRLNAFGDHAQVGPGAPGRGDVPYNPVRQQGRGPRWHRRPAHESSCPRQVWAAGGPAPRRRRTARAGERRPDCQCSRRDAALRWQVSRRLGLTRPEVEQVRTRVRRLRQELEPLNVPPRLAWTAGRAAGNRGGGGGGRG